MLRVEVLITCRREVNRIEVPTEAVPDVVGVGPVGEFGSISPLVAYLVVVSQLIGRRYVAHRVAAAISAVEAKCPSAHKIIQG